MLANTNAGSRDKNKRVRKHFTEKEDQTIKHFVQIIGSKKWSFIANFVPGRTAKQCRDRYMNNLKPELVKVEWSKRDDDLLIDLYSKHGPKWSLFCKYFNNRNQVSIKNRLIFLQKNRFSFQEKNKEDIERLEKPQENETNDDEEKYHSKIMNDNIKIKSDPKTNRNNKTMTEIKDNIDDTNEFDQFFDEDPLFNHNEDWNLWY
ncbi:hypothetical protein M9Y10_026107 [Tritrichomonas musculus]|uniref:Myb-like DNA-binding domain containing protein n=1 Tax=Tritrichomonas musculus TaxID=1915356 RepID=A0ABR2H8H1_9EUKA